MDGWSWMTAAFRAVLPVAHARFHEVADQAGARGNPDVFGLIREPTGSASEQASCPISEEVDAPGLLVVGPFLWAKYLPH